MLVDENLLHDTDDRTDDPVQTHAAGQRETEDRRHSGHHKVHGLHAVCSRIIGVCVRLRHQLDIEPLCKSCKEGDDQSNDDHDPALFHNIRGGLCYIETKEVVVLTQFRCRHIDIVLQRGSLIGKSSPIS